MGKSIRLGWGILGRALLLGWGLFGATQALAEHTRVTHPSTVGVEVLGRGLAYSLFWDRALNDDLVAGIGIGIGGVGLERNSGSSSTLVPVYFNYYLKRDQDSLFATGGVTVLTEGVSQTKTSLGGLTLNSSTIPQLGFGFESRSDAGFLFRVTAYALIGKSIAPWGGMSLGYSF